MRKITDWVSWCSIKWVMSQKIKKASFLMLHIWLVRWVMSWKITNWVSWCSIFGWYTIKHHVTCVPSPDPNHESLKDPWKKCTLERRLEWLKEKGATLHKFHRPCYRQRRAKMIHEQQCNLLLQRRERYHQTRKSNPLHDTGDLAVTSSKWKRCTKAVFYLVHG